VLVEVLALSDEKYNHNDGLISRQALLENYFERPWVLSEAATAHARLLIESAWAGVKTLVKVVGGKAVDAVKWTASAAKKLTGSAAEILKKIGGDIAGAFTFLISKLPGGDIVLEFLSDVMSQLGTKITEMGAAIKGKVEAWAQTAKKKLVDFLLNTIFRDPKYNDVKQDIYKVLGVTEDEIEQATNEMRDLGITTIIELNLSLQVRGLICEDDVGEKVADKLKGKLGVSDGEDALKVMGALENPEFGKDGHVNPENFVRGRAAAVIDAIWGVFAKMMAQDPWKYAEPLYSGGFFKPLSSGYGMAAAAFMGILAAGDLAWNTMVTFIKAIITGFKHGIKEPPPRDGSTASLFMGAGDKGMGEAIRGGEGGGLLKGLLAGLIKGSNIEVIVRALSGDPQKIKDAVKRIAGAIAGGIKAALEKFGPELISKASEGVAGDELEDEAADQIENALGDFTDQLFATG
jgi:Fe2+ transport system protein FeoA